MEGVTRPIARPTDQSSAQPAAQLAYCTNVHAGDTLARTRFFYTECSDEELYEGAPSLHALLDMLPSFEIVKRYDSDVLLRNNAAM